MYDWRCITVYFQSCIYDTSISSTTARKLFVEMGSTSSKGFWGLRKIPFIRKHIWAIIDLSLEKTEVICDAFPVGLGRILVQYLKVNVAPWIVSLSSKALDNVQQSYGHICFIPCCIGSWTSEHHVNQNNLILNKSFHFIMCSTRRIDTKRGQLL